MDLFILLWSLSDSAPKLIGGMLLWSSFLFYLDWRHKHEYRPSISVGQWLTPLVVGMWLFPPTHTAAWILLSHAYTKKNKRAVWGVLSPVTRGLQTAAMVSAFTADVQVILLSSLAITLRNLIGDTRDAKKDRDEGIHTIPVWLGLQRNIPYAHLISTMAATALWVVWLGVVPVWLLLIAWLVQLATYNLTPR